MPRAKRRTKPRHDGDWVAETTVSYLDPQARAQTSSASGRFGGSFVPLACLTCAGLVALIYISLNQLRETENGFLLFLSSTFLLVELLILLYRYFLNEETNG
jgi:hypothetical protein